MYHILIYASHAPLRHRSAFTILTQLLSLDLRARVHPPQPSACTPAQLARASQFPHVTRKRNYSILVTIYASSLPSHSVDQTIMSFIENYERRREISKEDSHMWKDRDSFIAFWRCCRAFDRLLLFCGDMAVIVINNRVCGRQVQSRFHNANDLESLIG